LDRDAIQDALRGAGKSGRTSQLSEQMAPEDISSSARDMTVLVSCWQ
jgi:hypothetical protein